MSELSGLGSMMSSCFRRTGQCKRPTFKPDLPAKPARPALWVGSSYRGTRNRHPLTVHTPIVGVDRSNDSDNNRHGCRWVGRYGLDTEGKFTDLGNRRSVFWPPGVGGSGGSRLSNLSARQSQGVTADFWYPSMRRATPATTAQPRPNKVSKLRPRQRSQTHENCVPPGWRNR